MPGLRYVRAARTAPYWNYSASWGGDHLNPVRRSVLGQLRDRWTSGQVKAPFCRAFDAVAGDLSSRLDDHEVFALLDRKPVLVDFIRADAGDRAAHVVMTSLA